MAAKTNFAQKATLQAWLTGTNLTAPTSLYVALFTVSPTDAYTSGSPTGTEVSGGSYARQTIVFGTPTGSPMTSLNTNLIQFPVATANWGTAVAWGILDASTGGDLLYYANLTTSQTINSNSQAEFTVGSLSIQEN